MLLPGLGDLRLNHHDGTEQGDEDFTINVCLSVVLEVPIKPPWTENFTVNADSPTGRLYANFVLDNSETGFTGAHGESIDEPCGEEQAKTPASLRNFLRSIAKRYKVSTHYDFGVEELEDTNMEGIEPCRYVHIFILNFPAPASNDDIVPALARLYKP